MISLAIKLDFSGSQFVAPFQNQPSVVDSAFAKPQLGINEAPQIVLFVVLSISVCALRLLHLAIFSTIINVKTLKIGEPERG
jgi:hypothetical protein